MKTPRALVLRAPGINCDRETAYACRLAGFETELVHINSLIREPQRLLDYHFLVIPGGFSYGDDLGAGTLLAKNLTIHLGEQLQQFIDEGWPVLGICNGFQVLVRAGLLPGSHPYECVASLTNNASGQFECRWIRLLAQESPCIFTRGIDHPIELPVAHGEGQFVLKFQDDDGAVFQGDWPSVYQGDWPSVYQGDWPSVYQGDRQGRPYNRRVGPESIHEGRGDPGGRPGLSGGRPGLSGGRPGLSGGRFGPLARLETTKQVPIVYTIATWQATRKSPSSATSSLVADVPYPDNPNGSPGNIAGVCNTRGNVFGLMPHPERYVGSLQHPQRRGDSQGHGDGLLIFKNAFDYAQHLISVGTPFMASSPHAPATPASVSTTYASSGVDISAADHAKELMKEAVRAVQGPEVLAGMGAFAGVFDLAVIQAMRKPALVASTDGVGTKTLLAAQAGRFDTIGYDLVNHSVNDLLTQGARPLFFMDYLAMGKLDPVQAATIVRGVANACREVGCALLGGETAEMPDVYLPGAFDLAGTIVGVLEQDEAIRPNRMQPGDVLLGFPSSGLHTNGYSLARRVFAPYALDTVFPELGEPLIDALLRPHRCYLREVQALQEHPGITIKGMAHITGGGFEGNISRILPPGIQAVIETGAWQEPPLFELLGRLGKVARAEMYRALNMGIGMALVFSPEAAQEARRLFPELLTIGYLREGEGVILT